LEVHTARASAVVVQRIPPDAVDWFLQWQRDIDEAAKRFPGFRTTDVYPPGGGAGDEWVVVIHFDDAPALREWLSAPARAELVARLRARVGEFELQTLPGGFGAWFTEQARKPEAAPPGWKMVLTVVLGLFPTVMLLAAFPGPYTARLGFAPAMLIGNFLSVSVLQWLVMPALTRLLAPWLRANSDRQRTLSLGGLLLILLVLAALVALFRLMGIGEG
jgi:antibiotic biosynthesis monooxygenase (ABM) superfamily enzyme